MKLQVQNLGKRFNRDWIFKDLSFEIEGGKKVAIVGHNGAGKSTLLKILGSYSTPTRGNISYEINSQQIKQDAIQLKMSFAAPYFNLIEEYTLTEQIQFHSQFKAPIRDIQALLDESGLSSARNKFIKDFSSGMKQRAKLILAFGFQADLILLDEPTSNLDESGIIWFETLAKSTTEQQTLIIASNLQQEIDLCDSKIFVKKNQPGNTKL
jgi:ABC-type multidrug transport system ATPase subunit